MLKSPLSPPALIGAALLAVALGGAAPPLNFERGAGGPEGSEGPGGPRGTLFISPSGQPFRAPPGAPYPSAAWFAAADIDHDGRLTLTEFRADAVAFFDSLDKNKDGVVDGFENQDYEHSIPEMAPRVRSLMPGEGMDLSLGRRGGRGGGDMGGGGGGGRRRSGRGAGGGREGAALYSYFFDPQPVSAADSDFSSKITLKEWENLAGRRFAMLDTTNAGYLALATLPKTPVQTAMENRKDDRRRERRRSER